jgi:hypothetical protein
MNEAEIKAIVDKLADVARVLHEADPADKAEVFRQLTSHQADGSSKRPSSLCGMDFSTVSEARLATYVHDPDCSDHGVCA